jgi:hypothetical protein
VEVHRRAIGLLQQLHAEVLQCRKANVEAALEREFNFSKLHIPVEQLSATAYAIIEDQKLGNLLFEYRMRDERHLSLNDARLLRTRSAPLRAWARDLQQSVSQDSLVAA